MTVHVFLQNLQALMNECIGHVIGKPHSPVTGLYIGKTLELLVSSISGVQDLFSVFTFCCKCITWVSQGRAVTQSRHNGDEITIQLLKNSKEVCVYDLEFVSVSNLTDYSDSFKQLHVAAQCFSKKLQLPWASVKILSVKWDVTGKEHVCSGNIS